MGKNGAGKSTLFRCILNFIKNYDGNVLINENNINYFTRRTISKYISFIPQKHEQTFNYSVIDTMLMGAANRMGMFETPNEKHYNKCLIALKRLKIDNLYNKLFNNLSGGEQQLVLIARALSQDTDIIIMDEPTSALDFSNQEFVMQVINEISNNDNISFLVSSHNPNLVLRYCKRIIALSNGIIVADGEVKKTINEDLIEKIYNIKSKIYNTEYGSFIQSIGG